MAKSEEQKLPEPEMKAQVEPEVEKKKEESQAEEVDVSINDMDVDVEADRDAGDDAAFVRPSQPASAAPTVPQPSGSRPTSASTPALAHSSSKGSSNRVNHKRGPPSPASSALPEKSSRV